MTVTNTPFMDLLKPDGSEHLRDWPWQNLINSMLLDNKVKITSHTYIPELRANSTNPTLGTGGVIEGKYFRISNTWILVFGRYEFGSSGINVGDGTYRFTLPIGVDDAFHTSIEFDMIGSFTHLDNDDAVSNARIGTVEIFGSLDPVATFFYGIGSGDTIGSSNPVVPAEGDALSFYCMYKEAPVV